MELCRHIFLDGRFCRGAALKDTYFCRHHTSVRATLTQARRAAPHHAHQLLPFAYPEDRKAIQLNLFLVQNALNEGAIHTRTANAFTNIMRAQMANLTQIEKAEAQKIAAEDARTETNADNPCVGTETSLGAPCLAETWETNNLEETRASNDLEETWDPTSPNVGAESPVSGHGFSHAETDPTKNGASAPADGDSAPSAAQPEHEHADEPNHPTLVPALHPLIPNPSAQTAIHQMYERFLTEEGEEIAPPRYFPNPHHCHPAKPEETWNRTNLGAPCLEETWVTG